MSQPEPRRLMSITSRNQRYVVDIKTIPLDKSLDDEMLLKNNATDRLTEDIDELPPSPHHSPIIDHHATLI